MKPEDIQGWFDFAPLYNRVAKSLRPGGTVVEVGCWHGRSLAHLAGLLKDRQARVYGVDLAVPTSETPGGNAGPLVENLHALGLYPDPVKLLIMPSIDAALLFPNFSIDFVMIDGGHDEASVRRDIGFWCPKVRRGGVIAGHDYLNPHWPGVRKAVEALFGPGHHESPDCPDCWEVVV